MTCQASGVVHQTPAVTGVEPTAGNGVKVTPRINPISSRHVSPVGRCGLYCAHDSLASSEVGQLVVVAPSASCTNGNEENSQHAEDDERCAVRFAPDHHSRSKQCKDDAGDPHDRVFQLNLRGSTNIVYRLAVHEQGQNVSDRSRPWLHPNSHPSSRTSGPTVNGAVHSSIMAIHRSSATRANRPEGLSLCARRFPRAPTDLTRS